jgi:hypothetical protein
MPARGVITGLGETYLVGTGIKDGILGQAIRATYWTKLVTDTFTILTPGEACLGSVGGTAKGRRDFLKDLVNNATDAEYDPFWEVYFNVGEPVYRGTILKVGSVYYRVRSTHLDEAGFLDALSDELDSGALVTVVFPSMGAYNPVTDSYTASSTTTTGFLVDRYKSYSLLTEPDAANQQGDMTLIVASSTITPRVGDTFEVASRPWKVLSVVTEQDSYECHARRA